MSDREDVLDILERTFKTKWEDWETSKGLFADAILTAGFHRPSAVPVVPSQDALFEVAQNFHGIPIWTPKDLVDSLTELLTRSGWLDLSTVERMKHHVWLYRTGGLSRETFFEFMEKEFSDLCRLAAPVQPSYLGVDALALLTISPENRDTEWEKDRLELMKKWEKELFQPKPVLPVQLSAVVSREAIELGEWSEIIEADGTDENGRNIRESWVRKIEADEAIYHLSLQLSQPVAPVQSRSVEKVSIDKLQYDSLLQFLEFVHTGVGLTPAGREIQAGHHLEALQSTHITTTQSAPLVTITAIPSSKEIHAFSDKYHLGFTNRQVDGVISLFIVQTKKQDEDPQITRAFQALELHGVPRERAGTVDNGIEVLTTRYRKATQSAPNVPSVDLVIAQKAYIDLLTKSLDASAGFLAIHGWKTPQEDIDEGSMLRDQIALITDRQGAKS